MHAASKKNKKKKTSPLSYPYDSHWYVVLVTSFSYLGHTMAGGRSYYNYLSISCRYGLLSPKERTVIQKKADRIYKKLTNNYG